MASRHRIAVRNEQLQLTATYLNGIGVGLLVVGGVSPLFTILRQSTGSIALVAGFIALCLSVSVALHFTARALLGRLEDPDE